MKIFTITRTNNKEWLNSVEAFMTIEEALGEWNKKMLTHKEPVIQVEKAKENLKEDGFLLHTFIDGFNRKWALEFRETKLK